MPGWRRMFSDLVVWEKRATHGKMNEHCLVDVVGVEVVEAVAYPRGDDVFGFDGGAFA